jgi:gliding motility-associated-like protein
MRKILLLSLGFLISQRSISQCDVNTAASQMTVTCGQSVSLTAFGSSTGSIILNENFNSGGFGAGWGATPGATSFSNPCSPGGVDGTSHAWMDNNTSVPRTLTSQAYNLTSATAGVSICFDLLFAEQGDAAPCEGPDEPDEGVYLQYSINGGATWIDIFYFDPNGGNDPQLTNWNNYCFAIPPAAITANTIFRWHQLADSGADYDHWGIDNVQIFQNDINAEVEWLHDGYSYGVGNPGGVNPNAVTPTTTTTYTAQITTGTGQVCTSSITITVLAPVYDVDVTANPTTLCVGDCATISGTAQIVLDPGGIETYENSEFALVASGSASVNINVQGINTTSISAGLIEEMVINGFNFSGSSLCTNFFGGCPCNGATINFGQTCNLNTSGFTVTLTAPGGCDIILVPAGVATGNYSNTTFVPVGGSAFGGTFPNGGTWNPNEPFSGLNGCDPNGVWTLTFSAPGLGIGLGTLTGWSITFNDPPIYQAVNATWSPAAGLSSTNTINTTACPTSSTNYVLTLNNGTPGCPTYTETFPITVDPCGGCIPPVFSVTPPPAFCLPGNYNLTGAVSGTGANIVTYHLTNADATNDVNPMGSTIVSAAGTYFVRVEDPTDPTCFNVQSILVTTATPGNATFNFINFCSTDPNGPSGIATPGGTFAFSPIPTDGATINSSTGVITNPVANNSYSVQYTTSGACPSSSTVTVTAIDCSSCTPPVFTVTNPAAVCNPTTIDLVSTVSGTGVNLVSYYANNADATAAVNPLGSTIVATSGTYWVRVEDPTDPTCNTIQSIVVTINPTDDASFTFAAFCAGAVNGPSGIVSAGGTFTFNPAVTDGATINPATGVISNGVATTTYTVEYTTAGVCSSSSTQNVLVNDCIGCVPPALTLNPGAFCAGTTFNLVNTVDNPLGTVIYTYHATNLDATNDANSINTVITNPGIYWVRAEDSTDPTCFTVAQVTITEIPLPQIVLNVTNTSCELSNGAIDATISGGSGNYTYTWSNNTTTVDLVNLLPGIYSLIVVDNLTGCTNNASASVQPSATPTAAFNMNPVVMNFPDHISVSDNLSNGATTYLWTVNGENFDFVSTSTDISLDLPIDTGNYEVCLIAFNGPDCSDTTCGYIEIRDEFVIWVPNTFTPDADEYNNVFSPVVSMIDIYNYDFFIYNRWGEIIFESHDVNVGWDGTYKGRSVKEGVYTWKIRLKSIYTDEYRDYNGHVNMLR